MNFGTFTIKAIFLTLLLGLFGLQACESDSSGIEREKLAGNWLFEKGTVDGKEEGTELLKDLTFMFTETEFSSNLLSAMAPGFSNTEPYAIEENTIVIKDQLKLEVKDLTAGTLEVSFNIDINGTPRNYTLLFSKVVG